MRFNNDKAIFIQIAELLTQDLLSGRLNAGDRFPSARDLASALEVNPNTAARALQMLADAGLAEVNRGTGYTVAAHGSDTARRERRDRFLNQSLPALFAEMEALGIGMDECMQRHEQWKKAH